MKTRYPIRKSDGTDFSCDNEINRLLGLEKHGKWLAGNNGMWHGGIHISSLSAPWSVLSPGHAEKAVPMQCIADGEVVAWRLEKEYHEGKYGDLSLRYSSVFLLVRSIYKPDTDSKTWLTFYTLYMHLAPLSSYPKCFRYKVTKKGHGVRMRRYKGEEVSNQVAPEVMVGSVLNAGDEVVVERYENFILKGKDEEEQKIEPFGLMQIIDGKAPQNKFWASLRPEYMESDGEQYGYLAPWMALAIKQGGDDGSVFRPEKPFSIKAGDAIGYMAEEDAPASEGGIILDAFTHIEVFSNDTNMPAFLNNPGKLQTGKKYVIVKADHPLYHSEVKGSKRIFELMNVTTKAYAGKIVPEPTRWEDDTGGWWFQIAPHTWIKEDGVEQLTQHDLAGLKFTVLEQDAVKNASKSLDEKWVSGAFRLLSKELPQEKDQECKNLSEYYSGMADVLDKNRDGKVSAAEMEIYRGAVLPGLRHKNKDAGLLLRRLILQHESEWLGKRTHPRWKAMLEDLSEDPRNYVGQWIDDHEWMSNFPELSKDEPIWHFHPVEFLSALMPVQDCARLIWGDVVNNIHGKEKGCKFRKKVVDICAELWGENQKIEYADVLMGCIAVETNRKFMATVAAYRKAKNSKGEIIYVKGDNGLRPKVEYHVYTKDEIQMDPSLVSRYPVGLVQFTPIAIKQMNITHGLSLTKLQLSLMDEIEQLDYVKLYFSSNEEKFKLIKKPDDVYTYIFCPEAVGQPDDAVMYSKDINPNAYERNKSLDSSEDGNSGNNDGVIQKRELLTRLNKLIKEGEAYRNECSCVFSGKQTSPWMPIALKEYETYKNNIETDRVLNERVKEYHNTTNAKGADANIPWCSSFVNWCIEQTDFAKYATKNAAAHSWRVERWGQGEKVDKPFYGALVVMEFRHVGFVYGKSPDGRILILGGNQGGGRTGGSNCISIRANKLSTVLSFMKPKGYEVPEEDYQLDGENISAPDMTYESTH